MIRHALRATPWLVLGVAAALIPVLLRVVEQWPYVMWPLEGIAVGLLAGTVVWALDEPAASIVDTLPRSLAWRTTARCTGIVAMVVWWITLVRWTDPAYFGHADDVAVQGVGATLATTAYVTWLRSRRVATPARAVSGTVVSMATFLALARPLDDRLPIFPYTAGDNWATSTACWTAVALAAVVGLAVTLSEVGLRRPRPVGAGLRE